MRTADQKNLNQLETDLDLEWMIESTEAPFSHKAYHEMADRPVVELDAMTQLENNVRLLADLQGRLSFMMREVNYLLRG